MKEEMQCQICDVELKTAEIRGAEIQSCPQCNGFWIKKGDLNHLIKHKAGDIEFSSIDHHVHPDTHGILKCLYCDDQAMIKINFIGYSDIVLDYCENCGAFWVDNGEIEKMEAYIKEIENNATGRTISEVIMQILYSLPKY